MNNNNNYKANKKTKIICTLGPASSSKKTIMKLMKAGMDIARINFSHGDQNTHEKTYENIRAVEKQLNKPIGILADLQGPKIRTTGLKIPPFVVKTGDEIWINNKPNYLGDSFELVCTYKHLIKDIQINEKLLLDDGKLLFRVKRKEKNRILLHVIHGGLVHEFKGVNLPGTKITSAADIHKVKKLIKGTFIDVIEKIERPEALGDSVRQYHRFNQSKSYCDLYQKRILRTASFKISTAYGYLFFHPV